MLMIGPNDTLDVTLFYSRDEAYTWLKSLTENQRSAYLLKEYLDIGYLLSYTAIFTLILGPIGLVPGILDLMETVPIILHLRNGFELPAFLGFISGIKWIAGVIAFIMIVKEFTKRRRKLG